MLVVFPTIFTAFCSLVMATGRVKVIGNSVATVHGFASNSFKFSIYADKDGNLDECKLIIYVISDLVQSPFHLLAEGVSNVLRILFCSLPNVQPRSVSVVLKAASDTVNHSENSVAQSVFCVSASFNSSKCCTVKLLDESDSTGDNANSSRRFASFPLVATTNRPTFCTTVTGDGSSQQSSSNPGKARRGLSLVGKTRAVIREAEWF